MSPAFMSRYKKDFWHSLHWGLLAVTFLLCLIGLALQYSASGGAMSPWTWPHLSRMIIGLVGMLMVAAMPLEWLMFLALPLYGIGIALLLVVEIFGFIGMGAQRWIDLGFFILQPSEPMKLGVILVLARYYHRLNFEHIGKMATLLPPLAFIAVPALLILKQPNLGTAAIVLFIGAAMLFATGVRWWKFAVVGVLGLAAAPVGWLFLLHDYQKQRILTFLNPEADPLGAGYNIMQSKIAIGSGGLYGRGYLQGPQSQLNFLPEKHTDFIFTMLAEEFGFSGSLLLVCLLLLLLLFAYHIALTAQNHFGRMIAIGVASYFFVHMFINMAMVMGLIPVVGVPLPFLSYGGTMLITTLLAVGLLLNVHRHRLTRISRADSSL